LPVCHLSPCFPPPPPRQADDRATSRAAERVRGPRGGREKRTEKDTALEDCGVFTRLTKPKMGAAKQSRPCRLHAQGKGQQDNDALKPERAGLLSPPLRVLVLRCDLPLTNWQRWSAEGIARPNVGRTVQGWRGAQSEELL
jgi:hypothetical protein